jgi:type IV secretion system protein VirB9
MAGMLACVLPGTGFAARAPAHPEAFNAVQLYPFVEGRLYRLIAAPESVTDIALQPGETLTAVASGDTARWTIGDTVSGSGENRRAHILLKPFSEGLRTNLVITTDKRTYHIAVESRAGTAMTAIAWSYPQDQLIALRRRQDQAQAAGPVARALAIRNLNFNYAISGDRPAWRPIRAFDDGRQTFIEFSPAIAVGEAPPLFVVGAHSEAQLVNYRVSGRYYVVDRLFGAAELRLGTGRQMVVRITRIDPSKRGRKEKAS